MWCHVFQLAQSSRQMNIAVLVAHPRHVILPIILDISRKDALMLTVMLSMMLKVLSHAEQLLARQLVISLPSVLSFQPFIKHFRLNSCKYLKFYENHDENQ